MKEGLEILSKSRLEVAVVVDPNKYPDGYQGDLDVLFGDVNLREKRADYRGAWSDRFDLYSNTNKQVVLDSGDFAHMVIAAVDFTQSDLRTQCSKENLVLAINAFIEYNQLQDDFKFYLKEIKGKRIVGVEYFKVRCSLNGKIDFNISNYSVNPNNLTLTELLSLINKVNLKNGVKISGIEDGLTNIIPPAKSFIQTKKSDRENTFFEAIGYHQFNSAKDSEMPF